MKKSILWVRFLSALTAVTALGTAATSVMMIGIPLNELPLRMILSWIYSLIPPALLLICCLTDRPKRPLLTAAAVAAAIPCGFGVYDGVQTLVLTARRLSPPQGAVGWLGWVIQENGLLLQAVGLVLFLWVTVDSLRGFKGLKTDRALVSVYAGLQGIRCGYYLWMTWITVKTLTDPGVTAGDPSSSLPLWLTNALCGILAVLCLTAAWAVLIWGGVKGETGNRTLP